VGFVLQGVKPAAAQAVEWWEGAVLIKASTMSQGLQSVSKLDFITQVFSPTF
jgi:hypothetical protein